MVTLIDVYWGTLKAQLDVHLLLSLDCSFICSLPLYPIVLASFRSSHFSLGILLEKRSEFLKASFFPPLQKCQRDMYFMKSEI